MFAKYLLSLCLLALLPVPAYAYLDPGTGSMLLQLLLAGIAGVAVVGKLFWHKITALFSKSPSASEIGESVSETDSVEESIRANSK